MKVIYMKTLYEHWVVQEFLSKVELTSLPRAGLQFPQKKIYSDPFYNDTQDQL